MPISEIPNPNPKKKKSSFFDILKESSGTYEIFSIIFSTFGITNLIYLPGFIKDLQSHQQTSSPVLSNSNFENNSNLRNFQALSSNSYFPKESEVYFYKYHVDILCHLFIDKSLDHCKNTKMTNKESILIRSDDSNVETTFHPHYVLCLDHEHQVISLYIEGTKRLDHIITDLKGSAVPFPYYSFDNKTSNSSTTKSTGTFDDLLYCHEGFLKSAEWFDKNLKNLVYVQTMKYPNYRIHIVGHSLGAAVGCILTLMWTQQQEGNKKGASDTLMFTKGRDIKCFCYGCPPCISLKLSKAVESNIVSFINGYDIVSKLSLYSLKRFEKKFRDYLAKSKANNSNYKNPKQQQPETDLTDDKNSDNPCIEIVDLTRLADEKSLNSKSLWILNHHPSIADLNIYNPSSNTVTGITNHQEDVIDAVLYGNDGVIIPPLYPGGKIFHLSKDDLDHRTIFMEPITKPVTNFSNIVHRKDIGNVYCNRKDCDNPTLSSVFLLEFDLTGGSHDRLISDHFLTSYHDSLMYFNHFIEEEHE